MSDCPTFHVKNFTKFQHYKDRSPPWIKLYNSTLDDYAFARLRDASKSHLIAIWLLASRTSNRIPFDAVWLSGRINATEPIDLEGLVNAGFIELDQPRTKVGHHASNGLASRKQLDDLEREGEIEKKRKMLPSENLSRLPPEGDKHEKVVNYDQEIGELE